MVVAREPSAPVDKLSEYKAKRNFALTPEPGAERGAGGSGRTFVIQKHWASRLHYDLRLELGGVMKSWAVPKGPSYDPKDKRMAVEVEDHPLAYSSFEGVIPAKQYGAGKVIIWDEGIWLPAGDPHAGLAGGNLKFELSGHKMFGKWALIRIKGAARKQAAWLLIKERDDYAKPAAGFSVVDEYPESVKNRKRPSSGVSPKAARKTRSVVASPSGMPAPAGAVKAALPASLSPQLATFAQRPPLDPAAWTFEIKFDGYRLLARIDGTDIRLMTRNGNDWTTRLMPLRAALEGMQLPKGWYDGEIVVLNDRGMPDFGALQSSFDVANTDAMVYYLFDAPYFDGCDMRAAPLEARRALLQVALATRDCATIRFSQDFDAPAQSVVASACKLGLEGIIAKRRASPYRSLRSPDWLKLKCGHRQEFVIGGWTDPKGSRAGMGALLLGVHDDAGRLRYAGKVGSGFSDRALQDIKAKLEKIRAPGSPFEAPPAIAGQPHWVRPELVAEVTFGAWTRAGQLRHAVFHALRTDKNPQSVVREIAVGAPRLSSPGAAAMAQPGKHALPAKLRVTHPDRVIDAASGITKLELVRYYALVGELMMEHLKGRPVSLLRAPAGIGGQLFFQKHAETQKLAGMRQLSTALDPTHPPMLEVTNKQGLLTAAQWNMVELHTQNAKALTYDTPDRLVFDLDPGDGVVWPAMRQAAQAMRIFLDQLGLASFLKTSGGKGLHVVVPLKKVHTWESAKGFSKNVVEHLAQTLPAMFVAKSGPGNRVGRIFIDILRNGKGATTVCAWSARARPGLGISVPVDWTELPSLKGGAHWTVRTAHTRLDQGNAPWAGYARAGKTLAVAIKRLGTGSGADR